MSTIGNPSEQQPLVAPGAALTPPQHGYETVGEAAEAALRTTLQGGRALAEEHLVDFNRPLGEASYTGQEAQIETDGVVLSYRASSLHDKFGTENIESMTMTDENGRTISVRDVSDQNIVPDRMFCAIKTGEEDAAQQLLTLHTQGKHVTVITPLGRLEGAAAEEVAKALTADAERMFAKASGADTGNEIVEARRLGRQIGQLSDELLREASNYVGEPEIVTNDDPRVYGHRQGVASREWGWLGVERSFMTYKGMGHVTNATTVRHNGYTYVLGDEYDPILGGSTTIVATTEGEDGALNTIWEMRVGDTSQSGLWFQQAGVVMRGMDAASCALAAKPFLAEALAAIKEAPEKERIELLEASARKNMARVINAANGFDMQQSDTDPSSYTNIVDTITPSGAVVRGGAGSYAGIGSSYDFMVELPDDRTVELSGGYDPNFGDDGAYQVTEGDKDVIGASFDQADSVNGIEGHGILRGAPRLDIMERFALDMALLAGEHGITDRNTADGILENIRSKTHK